MFIDTGVSKDGAIAYQDPSVVSKYFNKIPLLKQQNPELKVLVTNGGGGDEGFTPLLATQANRTRYGLLSFHFGQSQNGIACIYSRSLYMLVACMEIVANLILSLIRIDLFKLINTAEPK